MFEKIKIEDIDLLKLKVGDYFVIKDFAIETKHTSWFNGTNFDSSKIKYVLIECVMKKEKSKLEAQQEQLDIPVVIHSLNGNVIELYNEIRPMENGFFQNFPGVYCKKCGETFALYSYSAMQPHGIDENLKPFYNSCFKCTG